MRYNVEVKNKETKTCWTHNLLTREDIEWIRCNPNLIVRILSEEVDQPKNNKDYLKDNQE